MKEGRKERKIKSPKAKIYEEKEIKIIIRNKIKQVIEAGILSGLNNKTQRQILGLKLKVRKAKWPSNKEFYNLPILRWKGR